MFNKSGVYAIICMITLKVYIGSAMNFRKRWKTHQWQLKKGKHHSPKLQRAWDKYGTENFQFEIIEECSIENLLTKEQIWIDFYDAFKNGYNCRPKAENNLGLKMIRRTKRKDISGINNPNYGRKHTFEERELISRNHWSKKGGKPPNLGVPCSKEAIEKMKATKAKIINYAFISPENKLYIGINLTKFCQDQNLNAHLIGKLLLDKIVTFKGWIKAPEDFKSISDEVIISYAQNRRNLSRAIFRDKHSKEYKFIAPDNTIISIKNLKNFSKENGLSYTSMKNVNSNKNRMKSHKGYRRYIENVDISV